MTSIRIGYLPVGIKISPEPADRYPAAEAYTGISFCDAVRQASEGRGRAILLTPQSIEVCRWSPVVLGFRDPDPQFNLKVEYNLQKPVESVLLAPVGMYRSGNPPDTVIVRAEQEELKKLIRAIGWENVACDLAGRLDRSALEVFRSGGSPLDKARVQFVNETLGSLNQYDEWRQFTRWVFDRQWTTYIFDQLLDRYLSNMSMCRNTFVIPYLSGKANISYFCTGGIAWGRNKPRHLACGMPYSMAAEIHWEIE